MRTIIILALLLLLFSGCILDQTTTALNTGTGKENTVDTIMDNMRSNLTACGADKYGFGVNKLPCCDVVIGSNCSSLGATGHSF